MRFEECGIIVNMNRLPYDSRPAAVASGIRVGTPIVTHNGMGPQQMEAIAGFVDKVLRNMTIISGQQYAIAELLRNQIADDVRHLCRDFPMC